MAAREALVKQYCSISALVFGAVAVVHLLRVVKGWSFMIGPLDVPIWPSAAGAVVAGVLCVTGFLLARR
jgi:hypothetical protein